LTLLSDAVTSTAVDGGELLSIVMTDDPRKLAVSS
jgi:hypothetical protein